MSSSASDKAIALSSKKINMALDEIIKENKKTGNKKQSSAARLKNAVKSSPKKQQNNSVKKDKKTIALASPKVKKTPQKQQNTPTKVSAISPDKIKIQIQNTKAKPESGKKVTAVAAISPKKGRMGAKGAAAGAIRKVTAASPKKQQNHPARIVKKYDKPVTLNERFTK